MNSIDLVNSLRSLSQNLLSPDSNKVMTGGDIALVEIAASRIEELEQKIWNLTNDNSKG